MKFKPSIDNSDLALMVATQLNNIIPDGKIVEQAMLLPFVAMAMDRVENNFSKVKAKYYRHADGTTLFSHLMGDHYCIFLYYLSNSMYRQGVDENICAKIFMLNKCLHGIDAFYAINLPDHFIVVHPLGTVLGNATYGDYFVVYQQCTVGASIEGIYPSFGQGCIMYSASAVIGQMSIGDNTLLARATSVVKTDLPSDSIVFGSTSSLTIKANMRAIIDTIFDR